MSSPRRLTPEVSVDQDGLLFRRKPVGLEGRLDAARERDEGRGLLLAEARKGIPAGTACAIWTGVGAAEAVLLRRVFLKEPAEPGRLLAIALILTGVVVLKLPEAA